MSSLLSPESDIKKELCSLADEEILTRSIYSPTAFSILIDRYQAAFLRKAREIIREHEEAQDIVQETFTKIYRYASRFEKQEGAQFSSWAYKILMNVSFSHYQKRKKRGLATIPLSDEMTAVLGDLKTENAAENRELSDYIESVLQNLPEHFSRILSRYFLYGRNQSEIAREEGVSVGAIKTRMHRAKAAFRKIVEARM